LFTRSPEPEAPHGASSPRSTPAILLRGEEILRLVEEQVALGPRVPGSAAHDTLAGMLEEQSRRFADEVTVQEFQVRFRGGTLHCRNVIGVFRGTEAAAGTAAPLPLLLGTHYDTRVRADRERDPARRESPIAGANDGGSGTAVFLHLLPWLARNRQRRDVLVAFFDAEDLGNIDGKEFSLGAAWCADHPLAGLSPGDVVVLDMVGGAGMILDIDAGILAHAPSRRLTIDVFRIGIAQGWEPFIRDKPHRLKHIVSDHYPFACRGTASCILIDIDYPQWHTLQDTPDALSASSLGIIEEALRLFLVPHPEEADRSSGGSVGPSDRQRRP
jgi:glutaminyl-peptide cyclotransferase